MLELLQQRSIRLRDKYRKQAKRDMAKDAIMKPVQKIRRRDSGPCAQNSIEEVETQALLSTFAEEEWDREALEGLQRRCSEYPGRHEKERKRDKVIKPAKKIGKTVLDLYKKY